MAKKKVKVMGVKEGYDFWAGDYDESLGYLDSFDRGEFFGMMGDLKGKRVLNIGCGTGRLVDWLLMSGAEVVCADVSEEMLKILKGKFSKVETVVTDIEEMGFEDGEFDVVVAAFVVVHLKVLGPAFDEVYRVLKDGGLFVLNNINQRKAPVLKNKDGEELVIKSYYHRPVNVLEAMEEAFFNDIKEKMLEDNEVWINQIIRGKKDLLN